MAYLSYQSEERVMASEQKYTSRSELCEIHQRKSHEDEIWNIFGGIDNVISMVLSSNDINISHQLMQSHTLYDNKIIGCK